MDTMMGTGTLVFARGIFFFVEFFLVKICSPPLVGRLNYILIITPRMCKGANVKI
jgi:hypothetical protein